jgi:prophage antirepressor-like protein
MSTKEDSLIYCETLQFSVSAQALNPVLINGEPHFVAVEVCDILGLQNPSDRLKGSLDTDEYLPYVLHRSGQNREVNLVNESGLYNLIFQSRKPQAKAFRRWVTGEVLPTLRKTGRYAMSPKSLSGGSFIDLRDVMYDVRTVNGHPIRTITYEDEAWYSMNDISRAIGSSTGSNQAARRLRNLGNRAEIFYLIGINLPAWFIPLASVKMLLRASRKASDKDVKRILGGLK